VSNKENAMKKLLLIGSVAAAALVAAAPASAQFYGGAGPDGVGVQVGPFGAGVGPGYGWRDRYYDRGYTTGYSYSPGECRVIRERVQTDSGRLIIRTRRICD
jgi:hypothetical protein